MLLAIALSFVKLCDPFGKLALYHSSIHQHKWSIVCIELSLLKYFVKRHGYLKKGTHEGPLVMKKEKEKKKTREKSGHMKVH
jgi:2-polyprenyl-3-methyl-5-hydroxy-6-metoxy-1,4-benzoquinol methylase